MVGGLIVIASIFTLFQFAISYWRSILIEVAARTVSEDVLAAARIGDRPVQGRDFRLLAEIYGHTRGSGIGFVGVYYRAVQAIRHFAQASVPGIALWAEREMDTCTRYVGVRIDEQLAVNLAAL
jgi:hypothetical protein